MVVCGHLAAESVETFIEDFFHEDRHTHEADDEIDSDAHNMQAIFVTKCAITVGDIELLISYLYDAVLYS